MKDTRVPLFSNRHVGYRRLPGLFATVASGNLYPLTNQRMQAGASRHVAPT